ncbi:MAG: hypothetical protein R2697_20315 [Ilumatobacteraceae bacterium]
MIRDRGDAEHAVVDRIVLFADQPIGQLADRTACATLGADDDGQGRSVAPTDEFGGLVVVGAVTASEFDHLRLAQREQVDDVGQPVPAAFGPAARRRLARGEHDDRVGVEVGQQHVAEVSVERADQLVRVEHDERPLTLDHFGQSGVDLLRNGATSRPSIHTVRSPSVAARRSTSRSNVLLPMPPGPTT